MWAKYLAENGVSRTFWKNYWLNSFHTWHLPLWGEFLVFLASFLALWWPNIWPKMGFPELFEKTISSIHFIPGIYPYGVSLLTPIHFRVPSLIFLKNSHLCSTWLQNRNLYWIFLDEVGSDQSGSILSPFMGTACLDFFHPIYDKFQFHLVSG